MDDSTFTRRTLVAIKELIKFSKLGDVDVVCDMILKTVKEIREEYLERQREYNAAQFRLNNYVEELTETKDK